MDIKSKPVLKISKGSINKFSRPMASLHLPLTDLQKPTDLLRIHSSNQFLVKSKYNA